MFTIQASINTTNANKGIIAFEAFADTKEECQRIADRLSRKYKVIDVLNSRGGIIQTTER